MPSNLRLTATSLAIAVLVSACGGGGGSSTDTAQTKADSGTTTPPSGGTTTPPTPIQLAALPTAVPATSSTVMSCVEGPTYQCSGNAIIRTENGVALTSSGVQVYGKSTSDLATPIVNVAGASGFALASGGMAEVRLAKDAIGTVSSPVLLLSNLGISWDGKNERPPIIETFLTTQGRTQLAANGTLTTTALPDSADLSFYDFATKGAGATQVNYANNRYFPRTGNPARCPTGTPESCPAVETTGVVVQAGDWRTGSTAPDIAAAARLHEDGDVHAGNGIPGANNTVTILPGGSGVGVPFPGSKGYRSMLNYNYRYANLTKWVTQDGVNIVEWGTTNEHNQNRRGATAFGDVTLPANVPTTGTASYAGTVRGWYARTASDEPTPFRADAVMSVDFATRQVTVTLQNAVTDDALAAAVPVTFKAVAGMGAAGSNVANYLTGAVEAGALKGGLGGRYFGPVVATGTGGNGPAEAGGTFSLTNASTGEAVIAGFIAHKQ